MVQNAKVRNRVTARKISVFREGTCTVCAKYGIKGYICRWGHCRRFTYDRQRGLVRGQGRIKVSKAQRSLFIEIRRWCKGTPVFQEVIFPWSIGPRGAGYRYDIVVPDLRLIVEYDSAIHYKFNKHFHKNRTGFTIQRVRDQVKDRLAKTNGYTIFRVRQDDPEGGLDVRRFIERR